MHNWRDLIRARMARMGGGNPGPSRRPSSGRDVEMQARNQRLSGGSPSSAGRREVPGLPGLYFADDYGQAMQTAARSSAEFHSGDINRMMNHPAVGWSKSMAGIDGLAGSEVNRITGDTENRLAGKGITRDSTGTWRLGQSQQRTAASLSSGVPQPGLGGVPALGTPRAGSSTPIQKPNVKSLSGLGGQIAAGVKSSLGMVGQKPITPPATAQIGGGIRGAVQAALAQARVPTPQTKNVAPPGMPTTTGPGGIVYTPGREFPTQPINAGQPAPGTAAAASPPYPNPNNPNAARQVGSQTVVGQGPNTIHYPTNPGDYPDNNVVKQLPTIQGPQRLPGSAVSGLGANGQPVQPPASTITPGTNVQGQPVTLNPAPTAVGQTPTTPTSPGMGIASNPNAAPPVPAAAPAGPGGPTGVVPPDGLMLPNAVGMDWSVLAPYEPTIQAEAAKWGVDPAILRSVIALESQGNVDAQNPNSSSHGLLQIQPEWHAQGAAQLGYQLGTPEGDIGYFAALIAGQAPGQNLHGDPLSNAVEIMAGATAGGSPDYEAAYRNDINVLMGTQGQAAPPAGQAAPVGQPALVGTTNATSPVQIGTTRDPASGATIDTATGQPVPGNATPAPTTVRPAKTTGVVSPMSTPTPDQMTGVAQGTQVQQGDGLGIYAGPDADESWVNVLSPNGGVNGDYKQYVCDSQSGGYYGEDGCCSGGACSYYSTTKYFDPRSANQTVHPGYDIALENGTPFYAPIDAVVLGYGSFNDPANSVADGPGCLSPATGGGSGPSATINNCNWAYDRGVALGGMTDVDGSPIVINLDHVDPIQAAGMVGQQVTAGTQLGVGLDKGHVHVEAHGYCADSGTNVILDPSLVQGGFYNTHSACEGITRPVSQQAADQGASYMGTEAYQNLQQNYGQQQPQQSAPAQTSGGYTAGEPGYYQSTQLPPPSAYDTGVNTGQTGQVVTDSAGRQYEVMADGSQRLIWDPTW